MNPRVVIAVYKPKQGQTAELVKSTLRHYPILKNEGLVTDRQPVIVQGQDGTIIEIFEWKSEDAIKAAHTNPAVLKLWEEHAKLCDYIPIGQVEEAGKLFSEFVPVNL